MTGPKMVAAVLARFEVTVNTLGELMLVGERTVRRWASGEQELSAPAEIVMSMLLEGTIDFDDLCRISASIRRSRIARGEVVPTVPLARKQRKEERRRSR